MSQAGEINSGAGPQPPTVVETLTPDVGSPVGAIANTINVLGYAYETADGTIKPIETYNGMSNNFLLANNTFLTPLVVDPSTTPGAEGTFTTIGAAILAAESGQDIFIRSGTYTENVTLAAGVNLTAFEADDFTPQVTIIGTVTASYSGTVTCSDIRFQTNGNAAILLSGSNQTILSIVDSQIIATNSTGISLTNSNAGSSVRCYNCIFDTTASGISVFTASSASTMFMEYCAEQNQAASNTASTLASTSGLTCRYSYFSHPITTSSSSYLNSLYCKYDLLSINATCLTLNGSTNNYSETDVFISGTASAISVGSALTMTNGMVFSSNTNAITGSGTLSYTPIAFASSSSKVNTTTQVQLGFGPFTNTDGVLYYDGAKPVTTAVGTAGQVLTSNGAGMAPSFQSGAAYSLSVVRQVFTTTGTYTPTSGMVYCDVEVVGAGGGSGGCETTSVGDWAASAGGGGGGYARKIFSAATIGASQTATVGAAGAAGTAGSHPGGTGGTSSLGILISATGGVGGEQGYSTSGLFTSGGGAGGTGSSGDFNTTGSPGSASIYSGTLTIGFSGAGGSSFFGGGAPGISGSTAGAGAAIAGTSYGGGGGGGLIEASTSNITGAAGAAGIVIVTEYINT